MHGSPERPPVLSVALVSAAALGYELLLMRLFSIIQWHHFAYMVISLALLGYGASGTFITLARTRLLAHFDRAYWLNLALFGVATLACYRLVVAVPFNAEEILWTPVQPLWLLLMFLLLAVPFFFAANAIALALTRHGAAIGRLYAADLVGAGLGSLVLVGLLFALFPASVLKVLGAAGLAAAFVAARERGLSRSWQAAALAGIVLLFALPGSWLEPRVSPYKGLSQALRISGTAVIERRSSPLGVLEVIESPVVPLRHAPGLSLNAVEPIPEQLGLFTDADGMTVIDRNPAGTPLGYLDQLTSALPYHLAAPRRVLVLGAGGGTGVQQALNHGVPHIDAVDINPQVVALVRERFADWSGGLYERDGVTVHIADARGFLRRGHETWDLVQVALAGSAGASGAGLHALNESYLYTVEALDEALDRLAPGGVLALTRWIRLPPRDLLKLAATAVTALERRGHAAPDRHLVLVRGWQTGTLLVKDMPFTEDEIESLKVFARERAFDVAWYPGMPENEANRFNVLGEPYFYRAVTALTGDNPAGFLDAYKFDIHPASDDRPYFAHFFQWRVLPEILALRGQGGLPLLEAGYLVLVATLGIAVVVSLVLVLLPLALRRTGAQPRGLLARTAVYFLAIGLAFLFLEIAFMQKFILFLHHPLYAVATVLTAFLVFAGLGSAWSGRAAAEPGRAVRQARIAVAGIGLLGTGYALLLDPLFAELVTLPLVARVPVTLLLLAPLAFCMGMPFPLGLTDLSAQAPGLVPWAWGINGCASVLSAVLATLLAIEFGFTAVMLAAVGLYILAAWSFPRARR